jgi:ADP-L-glycero-D-manno-heptose 6-epimerase
MWVITGGAGFIGSVLVWKLNQEGLDDLLVVDRLGDSEKWKNLRNHRFTDYLEAEEFLARLEKNRLPEIEGIVHLGACTTTMETDDSYLIRNNYELSKTLAIWVLAKRRRFIYASSGATYGDGALGYSTDLATLPKLRPLNMYGYSKHLFDLWALRRGVLGKMVGIKFFNVFGPNEYHKGDMRSVVVKAFEQIRADGKAHLFKSYRAEFADGEQRRDFLYVKDAVNVLYAFVTQPRWKGLFNLGCGQARTWNDLVRAIFATLGKPPRIEYIDMPQAIRNKYQYHTQADMTWIKGLKGAVPFRSLEEGVRDYVQNYLMKEDPYL